MWSMFLVIVCTFAFSLLLILGACSCFPHFRAAVHGGAAYCLLYVAPCVCTWCQAPLFCNCALGIMQVNLF